MRVNEEKPEPAGSATMPSVSSWTQALRAKPTPLKRKMRRVIGMRVSLIEQGIGRGFGATAGDSLEAGSGLARRRCRNAELGAFWQEGCGCGDQSANAPGRREIGCPDIDGSELDGGTAAWQRAMRSPILCHHRDETRFRGVGRPVIVIEARGRSQNLAKAERQQAQKHNGNCDMTAGGKSYAIHYG